MHRMGGFCGGDLAEVSLRRVDQLEKNGGVGEITLLLCKPYCHLQPHSSSKSWQLKMVFSGQKNSFLCARTENLQKLITQQT